MHYDKDISGKHSQDVENLVLPKSSRSHNPETKKHIHIVFSTLVLVERQDYFKVKELFILQIIRCIAHSIFCGVIKYISIRAFLKSISKTFMPDFRSDRMVSFKEVWIEWKGSEFERFFVFITIRLKYEVNYLI